MENSIATRQLLEVHGCISNSKCTSIGCHATSTTPRANCFGRSCPLCVDARRSEPNGRYSMKTVDWPGSIDFVARKHDGTLVVIDWKRSRGLPGKYTSNFGRMNGGLAHLHDVQGIHYRLQLNVYKRILERKYGYEVSDMLVVCCHPELSEPFVDRVPPMDVEVDILMQEQARLSRGGGTRTSSC